MTMTDVGPAVAGESMADAGQGFTVPAVTLRAMLSAALVAASKDETLPAIASVRVQWDAGQLTAVATDRYRLVVVDWAPLATDDVCCPVPGAGSFLLARQDVERIIKALPARQGRAPLPIMARVSLAVDDPAGQWSGPGGTWTVTVVNFDSSATVSGQLLTAQFPKWESLVPSDDALAASAGVTSVSYNPDFLASIGKVASFVAEKNVPVTFRWTEPHRPCVVSIGARVPGELSARFLLMPVRLAG